MKKLLFALMLLIPLAACAPGLQYTRAQDNHYRPMGPRSTMVCTWLSYNAVICPGANYMFVGNQFRFLHSDRYRVIYTNNRPHEAQYNRNRTPVYKEGPQRRAVPRQNNRQPVASTPRTAPRPRVMIPETRPTRSNPPTQPKRRGGGGDT